MTCRDRTVTHCIGPCVWEPLAAVVIDSTIHKKNTQRCQPFYRCSLRSAVFFESRILIFSTLPEFPKFLNYSLLITAMILNPGISKIYVGIPNSRKIRNSGNSGIPDSRIGTESKFYTQRPESTIRMLDVTLPLGLHCWLDIIEKYTTSESKFARGPAHFVRGAFRLATFRFNWKKKNFAEPKMH